jgi:hypothetical protein
MGLLDDLTKLGFMKPLSDAINGLMRQQQTKEILSEFQSQLEQAKAEQTEPTPTQETLNQINYKQSGGESFSPEEQKVMNKAILPPVTTDNVPDMMQQLDVIQKQLQKRGDIYGKFIPAIALLNPDLARAMVEDEYRQGEMAYKPVHEKVGYMESVEKTKSRETQDEANRLLRQQIANQTNQTRLYNIDQDYKAVMARTQADKEHYRQMLALKPDDNNVKLLNVLSDDNVNLLSQVNRLEIEQLRYDSMLHIGTEAEQNQALNQYNDITKQINDLKTKIATNQTQIETVKTKIPALQPTVTKKTIVKRQYSPSLNKTKIIYNDGTEEVVDGRQTK